MNEMDEIVQEFLVESHENLDQLDQDLLALEQDPTSRDLLGSVFRTIHTIKGTSGFLAYSKLEAVAHVGENLLSRLRDGALSLTPEITSALLEMVDAVRGLLSTIESTGAEGDPDHSALLATLTRLQTLPVDTAEAAEAPAPAVEPEPIDTPKIGEVLLAQGAVDTQDVVTAVVEQRLGDERKLGEILVQQGAAQPADVEQALEAQADPRRSVADSSIRVDVDLLDALMNLVGELVLTRNQIVQHASTRQDADLVRSSQRLNLIASELQEGVMKTRMQPIDSVWNKVPRVVRDLSTSLAKQVRVVMEGKETELDRTILEATKDPLTHLVRNAVDHAIETPQERLAKGKPTEGTLLLRAFHEGGQVNIEITDDGKGIDPAVIGAKALDKGLVTAEQLARMGEREITSLIFLPGFSTAAAVTNVSGRGVGMDVVKTNIEKIGGTIDVQSRVGRGTTFRIKIPLTLAIIPALTVTCSEDRYAIPQVNLLELVRLEGEGLQGIETIQGAPVYRLRGNLLPLVYLDRELGVGPGQLDRSRETVYIVVLQAEERQFGLVVDDVCDTEEIVVKPLGKQLKGIPCYAGATILGDGRVALILDVLALAQQANVLTAGRDRGLVDDRAVNDAAADSDVQSLLVVGLGADRRMAIPLAMVTRLEEFASSSIEHVGSREVVQYRGQILPLVRLSSFLGAGWAESPAGGSVQVVVYSEGGRSVGLVVDAILDIAEQALVARSDLDDHGLLGSAVVQDHITELLDVRSAILAADPNFYHEMAGI
ncbi:MAG: chemotaxis protein CheA [Actinomycetota bacterium]|nr:chemotaxis protein CheA [Actinomycetota bacterium]